MKRISIILVSLLSFSMLVQAQGNRQVANIKIEDPLKQMPVNDFNKLGLAMEQLADLKEDELIDLVKMLEPVDEGTNSSLEYAISGLSGYVSTSGKEILRKKVALAYGKALTKNKDAEARSFILSQLQLIGQDESVEYIKPFLSDERLVDPASRALVGIGSDEAKKVLIEALQKAKNENAVSILEAIGHTQEHKALKMIIPYTKNKNENIRKAAFFALASIADPSSADLLAKVADESKYRYDKSHAFGSYLTYIKNLSKGNKDLAKKLTNDLIKKTNSQEVQARVAALNLLVELQKEKSLPVLENAFKDSNKVYRVAALKMAEPYMNSAHADLWIKQLNGGQSELQIEIMELIGTKNIPATLPAIKGLLTSSNQDVKVAAIKAAGQLGGEAMIPDFLTILKKGESKEVGALKNAFLTMKGAQVNTILTNALPTLSLASKSAVLSILDNRGAKESATVYPVKEFNAEAEKNEGFHILFDGTNMDQWTGNTKDYTIEYGEMVINPSKGSGGNLYTKEEFADFIFRFEFKLSEGANNGLGVRTPLKGNAAYEGIEIQIIDNDADVYKYLKPYQYHGSLYGIMEAKRGFLNPVDMWNYQEVQIKGDNFKVILNGNVILDGSVADAKANGTLDSKEHPGLFRKSGHIAFLGHGSQVYFRNMRVKKL